MCLIRGEIKVKRETHKYKKGARCPQSESLLICALIDLRIARIYTAK